MNEIEYIANETMNKGGKNGKNKNTKSKEISCSCTNNGCGQQLL